jgi:hypothetical protein
MSKFILFFRGGNIPEDKKDKSIIDRLNWMDQLKGKDRFVELMYVHTYIMRLA